jgi:hypothetical protein
MAGDSRPTRAFLMASKGRKKPSLHSLFRLPINLETFFKELEGESDRACALVAGSAISEGLADLLTLHFAKLKEFDINHLFYDRGAPLIDFATRTDIAFALGLISPQERHVANIIRKIRNEFAHTLAQFTFSHVLIVSTLAKISPDKPPPKIRTKQFFNGLSMRLYLTLRARCNYLTKQRSGLGLGAAGPVPLYELCKETGEIPWLGDYFI